MFNNFFRRRPPPAHAHRRTRSRLFRSSQHQQQQQQQQQLPAMSSNQIFPDASFDNVNAAQQAHYSASASSILPEVEISILSSDIKLPGPIQPALDLSSSEFRSSPVKPMTTTSNSIATSSPKFSNGNKIVLNAEKNEVHHHPDENMIPITSEEKTSKNMLPSTADDISNTVELLVNAAELREAALRESSVANGTSTSTARAGRQKVVFEEAVTLYGGPFTALELGQLTLVCNSSAAVASAGSTGNDIGHPGVWSTLGEDLLSTLTPMLRTHVISASGIDLVSEGRNAITRSDEDGETKKTRAITIAQWMNQSANCSNHDRVSLGSRDDLLIEPGGGYRRLQVLICGLQSANILLSIMSCSGIDRRAVEDDTIEACVNLIKSHIQKHLVPALSNTGHLGTSCAASNCSEELINRDDDDALQPPKAKRPKTISANRGVVAKGLKAVYTPILSTIGSFGTILERAKDFISGHEMDDRLLFTLSSAVLSTLTIDASPVVRADVGSLASIVQESAIDLVVAIFGRYPRHQSIVIEDLFQLLLKLPTSKRSLRTYLVRNSARIALPSVCRDSFGDNDSIQPICALALLLIQSCVVVPVLSSNGDKRVNSAGTAEDGVESDEEEEELASKANETSGLERCNAVCERISLEMLQRCSRKGEEGGASEFRPILFNWIDDLLRVRNLIEFPAAEMLLLNLSHRLGRDLLRASALSKSQVVEATYLATAMEAFGKITSAVAGTLRLNKESPFKLTDKMGSTDLNLKEEVNRCFCGRGHLDTFMVDCDRCHCWYHGSCIGITKDNVPDEWICDECKLQITMLDQAKIFSRMNDCSTALTSRDLCHVIRQFILSLITRSAQFSTSSRAKRSREFFIASWAKIITMEEASTDRCGSFDLGLVRSHVVAQWYPPDQLNQCSTSFLSNDGNVRIMSTLAASSELSLSFPRLLGVLLRLMGDNMATLRKLALKAFLQVANVDPSLMLQPLVRKEVSRCFHDDAISVREAAVNLVGDYVLQSPNLAAAFHSSLLERMTDKGISVRKRAVKIFRDILLSDPSYGGRASAMHSMLQRADDRKEDDGVRDLVHETFHTLWFNGNAFQSGKFTLPLAADISSEHAHIVGKTMTKAELYCHEAAKQMVEVVKVSGSAEFLTSLVNGLLFGFNEGDKDKKMAERKRRQEDSRNQCKSLVSALVELLLSFEETRSQNEDEGKDLVALLSVVCVFSQTHPELIVPHIDTLLPYLKGDNGTKKYESSIVSVVSNIISLASSHLSSAEWSQMTGGELPEDLVGIAYKFPPSAVGAAVEALANLAKHSDAHAGSIPEKKLFSMAVRFYTYLLKNRNVPNGNMKKSIRDNIRRALSALGSICRFHECQDGYDSHSLDLNSFSVITDIKQLKFSGNVLSSACFALFKEYLEQDDEPTKCLALRAMNGVFISRPRVVLAAEQFGIFTSVVSEQSPSSVQIESLRCWRDILLAEENRIESGVAKKQMQSQATISVSKRISGDQDGDACISGSVLTKHADRLYELILSNDERVRHMIIELIGHLLRQGLINPMATVPHLLAVQGDVESPRTRSLALKLLILEGEKRPDMLRQRICAGLKQAYSFQKVVYPHDAHGAPRVTALLTRNEGTNFITETIFDAVIKESAITNKRTQREGLLKGIISLFEKDPDSEDTHVDLLPLLSFASEILAHLPYNSLNDPLFIVYQSSCITALDGQAIINRFAEILGGDICDPNSNEDEIERAWKKNSTLDPKNFGLKTKSKQHQFSQLCVNACRILPLLQLKKFLVKAYNLSEARMSEYVPSEKERINEKGVSIGASIAAFSCCLPPIFDMQQNVIWSNAAEIYASIRLLMRESESENIHVDTEAMKKSPKPKSGQKRKRGDSDVATVPQASPKVSPD